LANQDEEIATTLSKPECFRREEERRWIGDGVSLAGTWNAGVQSWETNDRIAAAVPLLTTYIAADTQHCY